MQGIPSLARAAAVALCALMLPAAGLAAVSHATDACDPERYLLADGHQAVPSEKLISGDWYSAKTFPGHNPARMAVPDGELDVATRAMLLVEHVEPSAERSRWELRYRVLAGSRDEPDINACTVVELRRYNLTRAVHDQLRKEYPEAAPKSPGPQASLPHVSWRFWMTTTQGMRADVILATRRTFSDAQAASARCAGQPCLAPDAHQALLDQPGTTQWKPPSRPAKATYRATWPAKAAPAQAMSSPARAVQELFHTPLSGDPLPYLFKDDPAHPPLVLLLDRNTSGQEDHLIGSLHETGVLDDAISEVWTQRLEVRGMEGKPQVDWQQRPVCRRSKQPPCA